MSLTFEEVLGVIDRFYASIDKQAHPDGELAVRVLRVELVRAEYNKTRDAEIDAALKALNGTESL